MFNNILFICVFYYPVYMEFYRMVYNSYFVNPCAARSVYKFKSIFKPKHLPLQLLKYFELDAQTKKQTNILSWNSRWLFHLSLLVLCRGKFKFSPT